MTESEPILTQSPQADITPVPPGVESRPQINTFRNSFLRLLLFSCGLGLIAGFTLAASLNPSPHGFGTHQQLGLPPCSIQMFFGVPCPSCGMTTSFSWFVRGNLLQSLNANVAGTYLAVLSVVAIPWTFYHGWIGRLPALKTLERWLVYVLLPMVVLALIQWGVRFVAS